MYILLTRLNYHRAIVAEITSLRLPDKEARLGDEMLSEGLANSCVRVRLPRSAAYQRNACRVSGAYLRKEQINSPAWRTKRLSRTSVLLIIMPPCDPLWLAGFPQTDGTSVLVIGFSGDSIAGSSFSLFTDRPCFFTGDPSNGDMRRRFVHSHFTQPRSL